MLAAKRILRYIQGTSDYSVLFPFGEQNSEVELIGFATLTMVEIWLKGKALPVFKEAACCCFVQL